MMKTLALYGFFGLVCAAAHAQGQTPSAERLVVPARDAAPAEQPSERRVALRAALLAQRGVVFPSEQVVPAEHQLSEKERAELRQQLRQQRRQ